MDRKKDGKGNSSAATRRVTAENAPLPVFCETRKDAPGVSAMPPYGREYGKFVKEKAVPRVVFSPFSGYSLRRTTFLAHRNRKDANHAQRDLSADFSRTAQNSRRNGPRRRTRIIVFFIFIPPFFILNRSFAVIQAAYNSVPRPRSSLCFSRPGQMLNTAASRADSPV